jgi:hypothetical protein
MRKGRLKEPPALCGEEWTEYKSATGCLQWLSGQSRADLAAGTSLLQKGSPTIQDLNQIYGLVEYARSTADCGFAIKPLDLSKLIVIAYGDSSFANAPEGKTQVGRITTLSTSDAFLKETDASVFPHKSNRAKRMLRSTLAAEAAACDAAVDNGFYTAAFLQEILYGKRATQVKTVDALQIPLVVVTDCRSLFDALQKITPTLDEKRTAIDVAAIKEIVKKENIRWVPSGVQRADGLTKLDMKLMLEFTKFLNDPTVILKNREG